VLRVGAAAYNVEDISNVHAHLSNHCLAVDHPDYGKYEPTNELWYSQFDAWLQECHPGRRFEVDVLPSIRRISAHTMLSAKEQLQNPPPPETPPVVSFNLWGLDYMLDADFHCTLLEANVSPACAEELLPAFGEDFVHEVLDPLFPPKVDVGSAGECGNALRHVESGSFKRGFEVLWSPQGGFGTQVPR
jgi:hypothetical protein